MLPLFPAMAQAESVARFDFVEYRATEPAPDDPEGTYRNPVLPGFHPDPSLVRVGNDFYLVTSTFTWFPGLPVFHSRDLVHWDLIAHAIDRPGMVDYSGMHSTRGLYAPAITHDGERFWILNTCVDCDGNFAITAEHPEGPWSDPVILPFNGIDPSLFFDDDGSAWIVYNDAPPGPPQYEGHRALWLQRFDPVAKVLVGERHLLVDGGVDFSEQPVWAEGPHIYKVDGWYYLLAAEGGTADQHSQTIYRSRAVTGPYEPGPVNPILTQRNLDPARPDRVEATGHADMVRLDDGSWWATFLATRPFAGQSTLLGRETFLLPVTWKDGWPLILEPGQALPPVLERPKLPPFAGTDWSHWRDDFDGPGLEPEWIRLHGAGDIQYFGVDGSEGELWLTPVSSPAAEFAYKAFTGRRLRHPAAEVTTRMSFAPSEPGEFAGLLAFMNESHFLAAGIERQDDGVELVVRLRSDADQPEDGAIVASQTVPGAGEIELKLAIDGGTAAVSWRTAGTRTWRQLASGIDIEPLASVHAGLFTGLVIGPYAVSGIDTRR